MDLTQIQDLETFVLEADRLQRVAKVQQEVMSILESIRNHKEALRTDKESGLSGIIVRG